GGLRYGLHELEGRLGNRQIALFHKFSNVHLPAVKVLIRFLIGAQDGALQRNAGKGTAGSRINKNLRPHGGSRIGGCVPAFWPGSSGSVNAQRDLLSQKVLQTIGCHEQHHDIGLLATDLKSETAARYGNHGRRSEWSVPRILLTRDGSPAKLPAEAKRCLFQTWNHSDTLGSFEKRLGDLGIGSLDQLVEDF